MRGMPLATRYVRPEPVEGLSFFRVAEKREGQGFDKLSPNGFGVVCFRAPSTGCQL